jgi:hypothetical protein
MTKHTIDRQTTVALRDLDPAPAATLTSEERARADAAFARIVATPPEDRVPGESDRPRRRRSRLLVPAGLAGAAGAAVTALLVSGGSALASWTPEPQPLAHAAAAAAAATCRVVLEVPGQGARVAVAERRGGWTYVLIAGPAGQAACLMPDDLVGQPDPAEHRGEGFFGGYSPDPVEVATPGRDRIVETESTAGSVIVSRPWPLRDEEGWFSSVQGYVGSDVTRVTVHTPTGADVEASVAGGRFAAWWPSEQPGSDHLDAMGAWTYTVTLVDGTTRRVRG